MSYILEKPLSGWLEILPGVKVHFLPISRPMVRAAQRAMLKAQDELDPEASEEDRQDAGSEAFDQVIIGRGMTDWEGIGGGPGKGKALAFSPEVQALFLADPVLMAAANQAYVLPFMLKGLEKNASSPSRSGTSAGATRAKTIASSAATPGKAGAAKSAPTASTKRSTKTATASGKSSGN